MPKPVETLSTADLVTLMDALGLRGKQIMTLAPLGTSTEWFPIPSFPIRLAAELAGITSGSAQVTIDGSDDGETSTVQIGTFTLDTVGQRVVTPATNFNTAYIRLTVLSGAEATVNAWKGI